MGVGSEKTNETQGAENVGDGKQCLCHQCWVPRFPGVSQLALCTILLKKKKNNSQTCSILIAHNVNFSGMMVAPAQSNK